MLSSCCLPSLPAQVVAGSCSRAALLSVPDFPGSRGTSCSTDSPWLNCFKSFFRVFSMITAEPKAEENPPAQEGTAQVCALPSALPRGSALPPSRLLAELPSPGGAEGATLTSNVIRSQQQGCICQLIFSMPNVHGYCQDAN